MIPAPNEFNSQTFGIYPRVSTVEQAKDDKASLDAQIDACREYGEGLGMQLDAACVRKEAYTSTTTERPVLAQLLAEMRARRVTNLVIDRADRLTRQGMLGAAVLLSRFVDAGILLHIASMNMVVRDDTGIRMYLDLCWAAQQSNKIKTAAVSRARRAYARAGRPYSGTHPPYGFLKVTDRRDERGNPTAFHFAADLREIDGYRPWEVRRDICRWYLAGMSGWKIAKQLTEMRAPTSRTINNRRGASVSWSPEVVYEILADPLNEGIATTYRTEIRDGRQVRLDREKHIVIPNAVSPDAIILTPTDAERIRARLGPRGLGKQFSPRRAKASDALPALLAGGMGRCGLERLDVPGETCGWALRLKRPGHGNGLYYACARHGIQPAQCAGQSIPVWQLDWLVWLEVQRKLVRSDELERLAEQQAQLDTADSPTSERARYQAIRDEQVRKRTRFLQSIGDTEDPDTRTELTHSVDRCNEVIRDADKHIAALSVTARDDERRRAIFGNVYRQRNRHLQRVWDLDTRRPGDVPYIRTICRSLGVRAVVRKTTEPEPYLDVKVEFNLGAATGEPWFGPDVVESETRREYLAQLADPSEGEDASGVSLSDSR